MCLQDHVREASLDRVEKRVLCSPDFTKPYSAQQKRQSEEMTPGVAIWPPKPKSDDRGLGRVIQMYPLRTDTEYDDTVSYINFFFKESTMEKALSNLGRVKHLLTSKCLPYHPGVCSWTRVQMIIDSKIL